LEFASHRWFTTLSDSLRYNSMSYNNNPKAALLKFKQKINSHKFNPITLPNPVFSKKRTRSTNEEPKKQSPTKKQKFPEHNEMLISDTELHAKFDSGDFGTKKIDAKVPKKNTDFLVEKKKPLNFRDQFKSKAGNFLSKGIFGNTKSSDLVSNDPSKKNTKKGYNPYRAIYPLHENNYSAPEKEVSTIQRKNNTPKIFSRQLFYNSDDEEEETKVFSEIESAISKEMKKEKESGKKPKAIERDILSGKQLTIRQLCEILSPMVDGVRTEFDDVNELYEINNGWFEHTASLSGHIENLTHYTTSKLLDE
jgi:hypothetical protein